MKYLIALFILFSYNSTLLAYDSKTIKIAVLDTGYDFGSTWETKLKNKKLGLVKPKLCKHGHKDFTGTSLNDEHGHGTHIVGLVAKHAKDANYCIVVLKTWSPKLKGKTEVAVYKAVQYATRIGVDIINYSGGGKAFFLKEYLAVKKALDKGIVMVVAAGNEKEQIDHHVLKVVLKYKYEASGKQVVYRYKPYYIHRKTGEITTKDPKNTFYPAGYDPRIISVENIDSRGRVLSSSNYGEMSYHQEVGDDILSLMPHNVVGKLTGTSQSAAIRTGKMVNKWNK